MIAGDNARIQRPLAAGDWRVDPQRKDLDAEPGAQLRDVFLFDIELVGTGEPGDAATGESGVDTISGNGGEDILIGQGNGAGRDAYGTESGSPGRRTARTRPAGLARARSAARRRRRTATTTTTTCPTSNDPQCRSTAPGDTLMGETGEDYIEGNQGSDKPSAARARTTSSAAPPQHRPPERDPAAGRPRRRLRARRDHRRQPPVQPHRRPRRDRGQRRGRHRRGRQRLRRPIPGAAGAWLTMAGPGAGPFPATDRPNSQPARAACTATDMVRRDVTTRSKESAGAFGNDYVKGGGGKDDVYGLLGNDWLEGNEEEDAIVGDMGKIVNNQIGGPTPDTIARSAARPVHHSAAAVPRCDDRRAGQLKREVTLYAFTGAQPPRRDRSRRRAGRRRQRLDPHRPRRGPRERQRRRRLDLARRQLHGDDRRSRARPGPDGPRPGRCRLGRQGHDHIWGGYGADYLDVRPRATARCPASCRRAIRRRGSRSPAARRRTTPSSTARRTSRASTTSTAAGIRTRCRRTKATTVRSPATGCSTGPASTTGTTSARRRTATGSRRAPPRRVCSSSCNRCRRAPARRRRPRRDVRVPRDRDRVPERARPEHEPDPSGHARPLHLRAGRRHSVSLRIACARGGDAPRRRRRLRRRR